MDTISDLLNQSLVDTLRKRYFYEAPPHNSGMVNTEKTVPSKIHGQPNFQCDDIWRWSLWEMIRFKGGGALTMGSASLEEEETQGLLFLSVMQIYRKVAICKQGEPSPVLNHTSTQPHQQLLVFKTVRNKFLLLKSPVYDNF